MSRDNHAQSSQESLHDEVINRARRQLVSPKRKHSHVAINGSSERALSWSPSRKSSKINASNGTVSTGKNRKRSRPSPNGYQRSPHRSSKVTPNSTKGLDFFNKVFEMQMSAGEPGSMDRKLRENQKQNIRGKCTQKRLSYEGSAQENTKSGHNANSLDTDQMKSSEKRQKEKHLSTTGKSIKTNPSKSPKKQKLCDNEGSIHFPTSRKIEKKQKSQSTEGCIDTEIICIDSSDNKSCGKQQKEIPLSTTGKNIKSTSFKNAKKKKLCNNEGMHYPASKKIEKKQKSQSTEGCADSEIICIDSSDDEIDRIKSKFSLTKRVASGTHTNVRKSPDSEKKKKFQSKQPHKDLKEVKKRNSNVSNCQQVTTSAGSNEWDSDDMIIILSDDDDDDESDKPEVAAPIPPKARKRWASVCRVARKGAIAGGGSPARNVETRKLTANNDSFISLLSDSDSDESFVDSQSSNQNEIPLGSDSDNDEMDDQSSVSMKKIVSLERLAEECSAEEQGWLRLIASNISECQHMHTRDNEAKSTSDDKNRRQHNTTNSLETGRLASMNDATLDFTKSKPHDCKNPMLPNPNNMMKETNADEHSAKSTFESKNRMQTKSPKPNTEAKKVNIDKRAKQVQESDERIQSSAIISSKSFSNKKRSSETINRTAFNEKTPTPPNPNQVTKMANIDRNPSLSSGRRNESTTAACQPPPTPNNRKTDPRFVCRTHGILALRKRCSEGEHKNRRFYVCGMKPESRCEYFAWADEVDKQTKGYLQKTPRHHEALKILAIADRAQDVSSDFSLMEDEDIEHVTDFLYYAMRQYRLPQDGFIECLHCGAKLTPFKNNKRKKVEIKKFKKHIFKCRKIPKTLRDAMLHLRNFHEYQSKQKDTKNMLRVMTRVMKRMSQSIKCSVDETKKEPTVESDSANEAAGDPSSLMEIQVIHREKVLSHDKYPTLTITAWNKEKDYLYDFEAYVAPSSIPNSGNGAFLKLVRAREKRDKTTISQNLSNDGVYQRQPLTMIDTNCQEKKVIITPKQGHADSIDFSEYVDNNSLQFSSWESGCGSIDIGCYGPFFDTDLKTEKHYTFKNFLFNFEPASWVYGMPDEESGDADILLDITDDSTGETHPRARENIPMHVNEIGHNPDLVHNVSPLELPGKIHYYAHPKKPMLIGEAIELLVDYGGAYEEVRERKGYGRSKLGSDEVDSQRVVRNQSERVKIEEAILSESLVNIYYLLIKMQGSFESILHETNASSKLQEPVCSTIARRWTARFRMHWIEGLARKRFNFLRHGCPRGQFLCENMNKFLNKIQSGPNFITPHLMEQSVVRKAFLNEILEENIFLSSKNRSLVRPLDPHLWCKLSRDLVYKIAQELSFKYKMKVMNDADVIKKVYAISRDMKSQIREACTDKDHKWKLGFQDCDDKIINAWHMESLSNESGLKEKITLIDCKHNEGDKGSIHYKVRCIKIVKARPKSITRVIDEEWYLLWNIVRVVHILVSRCFPVKKGTYSLTTLCDCVGVKVADAEKVINIPMNDPIDDSIYVSQYADDRQIDRNSNMSNIYGPRESHERKKKPLVKKQKMSKRLSNIRSKLSIPDKKQTSDFIFKAHPNVIRNRNNLTFWAEQAAGENYPAGWIIHIHKRQVGHSTSRHIDLYWYPPDGKKLRSMPEIKRYLYEHGQEEAVNKLFSIEKRRLITDAS